MKNVVLITVLILAHAAFTQAQWEKLPLYGGHAWKLVQSKFNPDDIFAITERSGVWYSSDGGDNWRPINGRNNELMHQEVKDIEVGKRNEIFTLFGKHLYRSQDAGTTWRVMKFPASVSIESDSHVEMDTTGRLFINARVKNNTDVPLLLYSDDNGTSWNFINLPLEADWRTNSFTIDPYNSSIIILHGYYNLLMTTTDFGTTWHFDSTSTNYREIYRPVLLQGQKEHIFGVLCYYDDGKKWWLDYLESTDHGLSWNKKNTVPLNNYTIFMEWEYAPIRITEAGKLYIPGKYILLSSTDDGVTWQADSTKTNWDVLINKETFISSATLDGILTSSDEGRTWQYASTVEVFSAFSRIEFQIANNRTFFAIVADENYLPEQNIYELRQSTDAGTTWTPLFRSTSLANLRVTSEPEIRYYCMHDENVVLRGGLNQTVPDTILTWLKSMNPILIERQKFSLKLSPVQPGLVYISAATGDGRRLFYSTDGGDTWEENRLPPYFYKFFEIFPSQLHPSWVVGICGPPFSTQNGGMGIWLTTDYGFTWRMKQNSTPRHGDHNLFGSDVLYKQVWFEFSTDYGVTWKKNVIGMDAQDTSGYMKHFNTDGKFIITNGVRWYHFTGDRWVKLKDTHGMDLSIPFITTGVLNGTDVYAIVTEDGLYKNRISNLTSVEIIEDTPAEFSLGQNYPNPFTENTTISYQLADHQSARLLIIDMLGRTVHVEELKRSKGTLVWDGRSMRGAPLPGGAYRVIIYLAGKPVASRTMVIRR